jgi:hypothetical protein
MLGLQIHELRGIIVVEADQKWEPRRQQNVK